MVVTIWNGGSVQLHLNLMVQIENGYPSGVRLDNVRFSWRSNSVEEICEPLEKIDENDYSSRSLGSCHLLWYVKDRSELVGQV